MNEWLKNQLARLGLAAAATPPSGQPVASAEPLSVLLVDDTPANLQILLDTLKPMGHKLLVAKDGPTALTLARRSKPALVLLDVMMPDMDGWEVCRQMKADPELRHAAIIFCSAMHETEAKVKGLQMGAVDFITKPFEPDEVTARVGTHLAVQQLALSLQQQNEALRHELDVARDQQRENVKRVEWMLRGSSSALKQLQDSIERYAAAAHPVLISGPIYCGDEAVALAIHAASAQRHGPFIALDCSRTTMDDENNIFNNANGEPSKLVLAQGGTLYFAHVQNLSIRTQDRLQTHLQSNTLSSDGGAVATRIIAYASQDGKNHVAVNHALVNLLAQHSLKLPAVSERREDILPMASELLTRHGRRLSKPAQHFSDAAGKRLTAHAWPGNLHELEDVVVRSVSTSNASAVEVDENLLAGGTALGSYRLLDKLAAGGMGEVWKGRHMLLARPAAIKLIQAESDPSSEAIERFRREAKATSQLVCPHTVTLYDFGVSEQGQFYYVMELLDGMDLQTVLDQHGPLPPERMVAFLIMACKSLAEAHACGLVHRDLKPSNLFACRLGLEVDFLKVLDFGLAVRQSDASEARLTQAGMVCGTPDYMAPETATGSDELDGRTDIYSLGATAWHLLIGQPVFPVANVMQKVIKHATEPVPDIAMQRPLPPVLCRIVMRCLEKKMQDRPSARELWDELEASGLAQGWTTTRAQEWWMANRAPAAAR
jgi:DNA-binding NtrC family response regulator